MTEYYEQHPIPQQISAYQFRLVGDMTLKQFFQVAGGALVSILLYSSGLPYYVKWPLIVMSFLFGVALAFFPLEDRPLSKWLFLFFKTIYAPTLFVWKKTKRQDYFQAEPQENLIELPQASTPSVSSATPQFANLEKGEQEFLSKVNQQFSQSTTLPQVQTLQQPTSVQEAPPLPGRPTTDIKVPQPENIKVEPANKTVDQKTKVLFDQNTPGGNYQVVPSNPQAVQSSKKAVFEPEAAPPNPPTKTNVIVGQVTDQTGKIVENAIIEIKDSTGRPVRALKTNKLGHFMIVTPLSNGTYHISVEKEGLAFDSVSVEATGSIIAPIAITSESA